MLHDDTFINYHYHMFPARDIFTFIWYFFYNQLASLSVPAQNALRIIRNQDSVFYVHSFQATKKNEITSVRLRFVKNKPVKSRYWVVILQLLPRMVHAVDGDKPQLLVHAFLNGEEKTLQFQELDDVETGIESIRSLRHILYR
jgi:hypothetical protein